MSAVDDILDLKRKNQKRWRDMPESYWLMRLMQEVGELASSLAGDHFDPPEHELKQIASIAINWLEMRYGENYPMFNSENYSEKDKS